MLEQKIISELEELKTLIKNNQETKKTYSTKEVANMLGFKSTDKVDLLRHLGLLKGIKKGNGFIFPNYIVDDFLHDYIGLDISNKESMLASACIVNNRKKGLQV